MNALKAAHVRRPATVVALAAAVALLAASPAAADDITGDITAPEIVSLELQPPSVDVTDSAMTVSVTARFRDADTGVKGASIAWQSPAETTHEYVAGFTLTSGDASDGTYTASITIPHSASPGDWPLDVQVQDRVGNTHIARGDDLVRSGLPGYLAVASSHPDVTAPVVTGLEVQPTQVDVRGGPGTVTVRLHMTDDASGTSWLFLPPMSPRSGSGGADVPTMHLVSGTANDGWWEGQINIAEHAYAGDWSFHVRSADVLNNIDELTADDLSTRGMSAHFSVLSNEDITPPVFRSASLSAIALDVSKSDQQLDFTAAVTDDITGVQDYSWGPSNVQVSLQHPLGQVVGQSAMPRTSGTPMDGSYAATMTFPRHSATGLWTLHLWAIDKISNTASPGPAELANLGLPPAVLVYNTPLPPLDIAAKPGDATALVQWKPPADDRGAQVTDYVVHELPEGHALTVPADHLSAVMPNLGNGIQHTFVVGAINRAGESDPSQSVVAVPQAGLGTPSADPQPSPTPSPAAAEPAPSIAVAPSVINAGQPVTVTYRGKPGDTVSVWSKTQPAAVYSRIATVVLDANGVGTTTHTPRRNTRIMARSSAGTPTAQPLIQVRSLASLNVRRVGTRAYTFTGSVLPALDGRLVSLYRNGVLIAQTRTDAYGVYRISRSLAAGTFDFFVKTGSDTFNVGATSRTARVRIY